ncbi:MAG: polyprenol monophosphomannose synthase [Candidatus Marinimicrobia bacterium]|nr:polyprenol monophosphomannose synthase [Candidatus Neomarinimicrobiota bacterium]MBL7022722.1 polyprenol monophosphomannose synthase [Candidatus Neomarinimicrobiota bacterium]MBL7109149.1 polyprenol monophosphomannose synthase [Candidatus Neomarinimicrobiota bacterium]
MKSIIISPTYNERKNIDELLRQIYASNPDIHILFVDDNSPDGTGEYIRELTEKDDKIHLIQRSGKLGLGTAYCKGFQWALDNGYDKMIQMDADLSHNPADVPILIKTSMENDLVIGSRYISGINVVNWPMRRLILSYLANMYARFIIGLPIKDGTGGFKCFNRSVLENIDLTKIKSEGYSFQIEMNFLAWMKKFTIKEIPIIFNDRTVGESKMSKRIVREAIWMVPKLKLKKIFRRI